MTNGWYAGGNCITPTLQKLKNGQNIIPWTQLWHKKQTGKTNKKTLTWDWGDVYIYNYVCPQQILRNTKYQLQTGRIARWYRNTPLVKNRIYTKREGARGKERWRKRERGRDKRWIYSYMTSLDCLTSSFIVEVIEEWGWARLSTQLN